MLTEDLPLNRTMCEFLAVETSEANQCSYCTNHHKVALDKHFSEIEETKAFVNYEWIKFYEQEQQISLETTGMQLDAGGIAKGYAVDEAFKILRSFDIKIAIVDGGGDIYVGELPEGKDQWENLRVLLLSEQRLFPISQGREPKPLV